MLFLENVESSADKNIHFVSFYTLGVSGKVTMKLWYLLKHFAKAVLVFQHKLCSFNKRTGVMRWKAKSGST